MAPRMSQKAFCSSPEMPITFMAARSLLNCWVAFCFSSGCGKQQEPWVREPSSASPRTQMGQRPPSSPTAPQGNNLGGGHNAEDIVLCQVVEVKLSPAGINITIGPMGEVPETPPTMGAVPSPPAHRRVLSEQASR